MRIMTSGSEAELTDFPGGSGMASVYGMTLCSEYACVEVNIDFDDHLNPSNMRFSVFVGLVGEGASRTLGAQKLCPPVGKARRCVVPPLSVSCPVAQL